MRIVILNQMPSVTQSTGKFQCWVQSKFGPRTQPWLPAGLMLAILLYGVGCGTTGGVLAGYDLPPYETSTILPGDTITISFPGSPNLNTTAKIPVEGEVKLPFGKPIKVSGKTRAQVEQDLLTEFESQLTIKEVNVSLTSSSAVVYVSGAVVTPTKIALDRPLTLMEAIMEAGGPDSSRAKLEKVSVVRNFQGEQHTYVLDMRNEFSGRNSTPFYLRPFDSIVVPARKFNF